MYSLRRSLYLVFLLLWEPYAVVSFIPDGRVRRNALIRSPLKPLFAKQTESPSKEKDPLAKTAWYAVEAFGNIFGTAKQEKEDSFSLEEPPKSLQETLQRIKDDNDRSYFLSGEVDRLIYDEECTFSDPFVSFDGRDRFINNLANLGSFITKYSVKPLGYEVQDPTFVKTKAMVKLQLNLPWKPILAWPWGVEYSIDDKTNLIIEHKETWDIEPIEGVKQIFRKPTVKLDDNKSSSAFRKRQY